MSLESSYNMALGRVDTEGAWKVLRGRWLPSDTGQPQLGLRVTSWTAWLSAALYSANPPKQDKLKEKPNSGIHQSGGSAAAAGQFKAVDSVFPDSFLPAQEGRNSLCKHTQYYKQRLYGAQKAK